MQIALNYKRLDFSFFFCLLLTLIIPSIFTSARLTFFAPFLIISMYKEKLSTTLWFGLGCGLFLDLLSSYPRLGVHSLNFCIVLLVLYPQKRFFFADSLTTLPIMTFFFASLSSLIMVFQAYSFDIKGMLSMQWVFTDLIFMPIADATYAFCCFILPGIIFGKPQRRGKDYFL